MNNVIAYANKQRHNSSSFFIILSYFYLLTWNLRYDHHCLPFTFRFRLFFFFRSIWNRVALVEILDFTFWLILRLLVFPREFHWICAWRRKWISNQNRTEWAHITMLSLQMRAKKPINDLRIYFIRQSNTYWEDWWF